MAIILGIDPGSQLMGYAFLHQGDKGKPRLLSMGVMDLRRELEHSLKLHKIYEELTALMKLYEPTEGAIEAPFYGKDAQAMLKLGRCQGVAMLAMSLYGLKPQEYSPRSIKKAVTGQGQASKEQVARMLPHLVEGELQSPHYDAFDALGIAYCHLLEMKGAKLSGGKKYADWGSFVKDNPNRQNP